MPQESDSSTLISLLWLFWIFWNVWTWLEQQSASSQDDAERRGRDPPSAMTSRPRTGGSPTRTTDGTLATPPHLEMLLSEIRRRDRYFTLETFLDNAAAAYETVAIAFASGDRETLRQLASFEVCEALSDAIMEREARQESTEIVFVRTEPPEIIDGIVDDTRAEVSIRFVSEIFHLTRNPAGQSIRGNPLACRSVDVWTFARIFASRNIGWRVDGTNVAPSLGLASR
jgi:predicted lipid-binding transport protein (Tim44 family)